MDATDEAAARYAEGMRQMWGLAEYRGLAERLVPAAAALVDLTSPGPGDRVLDVAAGDGAVAALAAVRGARVTAVDISPAMVERGRERTGRAVDWREGNAEDLPLAEGDADVALSSFGVIFAPRPSVVLRELHRVLVPGGRLALSAWTADGFIGRMSAVMKDYLPAPPPGAPDQTAWAREDIVSGWLQDAGFVDVAVQHASLPWRFPSPAAMTEFFRGHSPAHVAAASAAGDAADAMFAAVERLASPDGGPVDVAAEHVLITARRAR
ncbi:MAG: class I SAM-dependent methyltransferase [Pseudonocardiaceae bacterium]